MKRNYLSFVLCAMLLLSGCGKNADVSADRGFDGSSQNPVETEKQDAMPQEGDVFLSLEYAGQTLSVRDLFSETTVAEYSLDGKQDAADFGKSESGYWMLTASGGDSGQGNAFVGVDDISGEMGEPMQFLIFDSSMHLLRTYEITDETVLECLSGGLLGVSPDQKILACGLGSDLYLYDLESETLQTVNLKAEVYFAEIAFSADGRKIAYYGYALEQEGTAYGTIDLMDGGWQDYFEPGFDALSLTVNGMYAVISHNVAPDQVEADRDSGKLLVLNLDTGDGKKLSVETYEEARIATVTADGKYVVTCSPEGDAGGRLRCYRYGSGEKLAEQGYSCGEDCKPYGLIVDGGSAYAVLYTESGDRLSEAFVLP